MLADGFEGEDGRLLLVHEGVLHVDRLHLVRVRRVVSPDRDLVRVVAAACSRI